MAGTQLPLLVDAADLGHPGYLHHLPEHVDGPPALQGLFQLRQAVEVAADRLLSMCQDENDVLDTGANRLLDGKVDAGPIPHRQHVLRHRPS